MKPTQKLSTDAAFFFKHAGYSYGMGETPEQGRTRGAIKLATAEEKAWQAGMSFHWEIDPDVTSADWIGANKNGGKNRDPWKTWVCLAHDSDGAIVASLGGIDFGRDGGPWGQAYRRVVEAELALESLSRIGESA